MTAIPYSVSLAGDMLHECLVGQDLTQSLYTEFPTLAMMTKKTDVSGRTDPLPVTHTNVRGVSSTFSSAQTYSRGTTDAVFQVTMADKYGVVQLSDKLLKLGREDKTRFVDLLDHQVQGAFAGMTKSVAIGCFRNSYQARGVVGSVSTTALTLASPGDAANFEVGDFIQSSNTDGGAIQDAGATLAVSAINYDSGILYAAGNWTSTLTSLDAGDFLMIHGDSANGGTAVGISGFDQWCPYTAPTTTRTIFGVDVSVSTLLHGFRFAGTSYTMEEAIIGGSRQGRGMIRYDKCAMNPIDFIRLVNSMSSKANYEMVKGTDAKGEPLAHLGFRVLVFGDTEVYEDPFCPQGYAKFWNSKHWFLLSAGSFPSISEQDGVQMIPCASTMDWELRFPSYVNCATNRPIALCNTLLPA